MKIKIVFSIILIFVALPTFIIGQEDLGLPKPGLTPDSPFYFFDTIGKKINLFFTFSPEKKAEKAIRFADERLAEAKAMGEKNKTRALASANQAYQEYLDLANQKTKEAKEKGKDVEELAILITEKTLKHQEVLIEVFEKVPEEAKTAIEKAIQASKRGSEEAVQAITGDKKEELLQKIEETRVRVEGKIATLEEKIGSLEKRLEEKIVEAEAEIERLKKKAEEASGQTKATKDQQKESVELQLKLPPTDYKSDEDQDGKLNLLKSIMPRVVKVACADSYGNVTFGSGFINAADKNSKTWYVYTNAHVALGKSLWEVNCTVSLPETTSYYPVENYSAQLAIVAKEYPDIDMAILWVKNGKLGFGHLKDIIPYCNDLDNEIGDNVYALGYPTYGGDSLTVTDGIISGVITTKWGKIYKTSTKIDSGNSGGLAINTDKQCTIGIPTWSVLGKTESLGYIQSVSIIDGGPQLINTNVSRQIAGGTGDTQSVQQSGQQSTAYCEKVKNEFTKFQQQYSYIDNYFGELAEIQFGKTSSNDPNYLYQKKLTEKDTVLSIINQIMVAANNLPYLSFAKDSVVNMKQNYYNWASANKEFIEADLLYYKLNSENASFSNIITALEDSIDKQEKLAQYSINATNNYNNTIKIYNSTLSANKCP